MKLYLLTRKEHCTADYDEHRGFVVAAESAGEARAIAHNGARSLDAERTRHWLESGSTACKGIGIANKGVKAGIVLADFNAG